MAATHGVAVEPITLVAMVKANVLNTLLLAVTIFTAVNSCLFCSGRIDGGVIETNRTFLQKFHVCPTFVLSSII
jgi:hypothetical protein